MFVTLLACDGRKAIPRFPVKLDIYTSISNISTHRLKANERSEKRRDLNAPVGKYRCKVCERKFKCKVLFCVLKRLFIVSIVSQKYSGSSLQNVVNSITTNLPYAEEHNVLS